MEERLRREGKTKERKIEPPPSIKKRGGSSWPPLFPLTVFLAHKKS